MSVSSTFRFNKLIAESIESMRLAKRVSKYSLIITMVLFAITYLICIAPSFYPADYRNPAVHKFLSSEEIRQVTTPIFERLKDYNLGYRSSMEGIPSELIAVNPSQLGLVVTFHYRLIPQSGHLLENGNIAHQYVPEITIQRSPYLFFILLVIEIALFLFLKYFVLHEDKAQSAFYDRKLNEYYGKSNEAFSATELSNGNIASVEQILNNFHAASLPFKHSSKKKTISNEYDVQAILHSLLIMKFEDIRVEEPMPTCGGKYAKIDFVLKNENILIECKKTREGLGNRKLINQIAEDKQLYRSSGNYKTIFFFIYDPENRITNPRVFERDLSEVVNGTEFKVLVRPV